RGLGAHVFTRGQKAAVRETAKLADDIPDTMAWLDAESNLGREYWEALQYVSRWTLANHRAIHRLFLEKSSASALSQIGNEHNFVWKRGTTYFHGKGATPAWNDSAGRPLLGLVPLNMAAPILLVLGKDNREHLSFAPHGAGRNLSRRATIKKYLGKKDQNNPEKIQKLIDESTRGLDIRWYRGRADLSESPLGYKSPDQVKSQIEEFQLAEVIAEIAPLGCVMAGNSPFRNEDDPGPEILTPKQKRQIQHRSDRRKHRQRMRHDEWED
ncbi:MAG: RtcB family protein, partial [Verrucomicrobiota bacterium]